MLGFCLKYEAGLSNFNSFLLGSDCTFPGNDDRAKEMQTLFWTLDTTLFYVSDLIVSTCIQINLVQIMMRTDLTLPIQPDKTQRVSPINISRFEICQNCEKKS